MASRDIEVIVKLRDVPQFVKLIEAVDKVLIARESGPTGSLRAALDELDTAVSTLRD